MTTVNKINYLHVITRVIMVWIRSLQQIPLIWLNKDQSCPKKVDLFILTVSKDAISALKVRRWNDEEFAKKKIIFTSTSIGKCHKCLERNLVLFVLAQFYSKKAMSQPLCFDIEYWGSYGPFLSNKSQWNKIQSSFIVHHIN